MKFVRKKFIVARLHQVFCYQHYLPLVYQRQSETVAANRIRLWYFGTKIVRDGSESCLKHLVAAELLRFATALGFLSLSSEEPAEADELQT